MRILLLPALSPPPTDFRRWAPTPPRRAASLGSDEVISASRDRALTGSPSYRRDPGALRAVPALLFVATFAVFVWSPNHQMTDSGYALLVSENLIRHGDLDLARYQLERGRGQNYRLEHLGAHTYYFFPVASSLLSVPYVAVARRLGRSIVDPDGAYATKVEEADEARLAGLLMAAFTVIVFLTARLVLPLGWSVGVALVAAFGTQVYSTASRTLWSDSWSLVLVGGAVYLLLRSMARGEGRRLIWLATLESWAYFARPTSGLSLAATALFLLVLDRRASWKFFATVAFWLAAFVADALARFGAPLPTYFHYRLAPPSGEALLGTLLSPSRGLLVCVPATLAIILVGLRFRAALRFVPLVLLGSAICVLHWIAISGFDKWWGGHCFGARLATGMVPWLVLLAVLGLDGARRAHAAGTLPPGAAAVVGLALLLAGLSVAINSVGAISARAVRWSFTPTNVDLDTGRLWSWRHTQLLAAFEAPGPAPAAGVAPPRP
jgi:hypothetical protein